MPSFVDAAPRIDVGRTCISNTVMPERSVDDPVQCSVLVDLPSHLIQSQSEL